MFPLCGVRCAECVCRSSFIPVWIGEIGPLLMNLSSLGKTASSHTDKHTTHLPKLWKMSMHMETADVGPQFFFLVSTWLFVFQIPCLCYQWQERRATQELLLIAYFRGVVNVSSSTLCVFCWNSSREADLNVTLSSPRRSDSFQTQTLGLIYA